MKSKRTINTSIDSLRRATKTSFNRISSVRGETKDKNLQTYQRLSPEHMQAIARVFGEDNLMQYIKQMEARKINAN